MKQDITSQKIIALQAEIVERAHNDAFFNEVEGDFLKAVADNMHSNFNLWHIEDQARRTDLPDPEIVECKRKIDGENQKRNDYIEKIDEIIISELPDLEQADAQKLPVNTETPGSVIDRMGISNLKIYHMREQLSRENVSDEHIRKCEEKLHILEMQRKDLAAAFDQLMKDLFEQKKNLRVYRQFKMYNDPELNPALFENDLDKGN
ncbi:DUF4254 domain-containing protein [Elusimicrobiota bacterium]